MDPYLQAQWVKVQKKMQDLPEGELFTWQHVIELLTRHQPDGDDLVVHSRKRWISPPTADFVLRTKLQEEVIEVVPRGKSRRNPGVLFVRLVSRKIRYVNSDDLAILKHAR